MRVLKMLFDLVGFLGLLVLAAYVAWQVYHGAPLDPFIGWTAALAILCSALMMGCQDAYKWCGGKIVWVDAP